MSEKVVGTTMVPRRLPVLVPSSNCSIIEGDVHSAGHRHALAQGHVRAVECRVRHTGGETEGVTYTRGDTRRYDVFLTAVQPHLEAIVPPGQRRWVSVSRW